MTAGANVATIVVMLLVGYSDRIQPAAHPLLANVGLTFPAFLALNMAFLVFWLMVKPVRAAIPVLGFVIAYQPVRTYFPLNLPATPPDSTIKVLSYNVYTYSTWKDAADPCPIADYIIAQDADIVCLQESGIWGTRKQKLDSIYAAHYQYRDTAQAASGGDELCIMSRFPIVGKEKIRYASRTNNSAAFRLDIGGDTTIVIVNHLQSTGLSPEDKTQFRTMMKGQMRGDTARMESRRLLHKLGMAAALRAPQADAVAAYVRQHSGERIILVGDFNDSPISYVRRTIAQGLTDCYVATASGPGISYHYNAFYVRIDNIMCSSHFTPYQCRVDRSIGASDHYPILCLLKPQGKKPQ